LRELHYGIRIARGACGPSEHGREGLVTTPPALFPKMVKSQSKSRAIKPALYVGSGWRRFSMKSQERLGSNLLSDPASPVTLYNSLARRR